MMSNNFLFRFLVTPLIYVCGSIFLSSLDSAHAQANKAFIVFVNGSGDCCAGAMSQTISRFRSGVNADIWVTSYANFKNGSSTRKVPIVNLSVNDDQRFILEASQVINNIPPSRPVVLIGHSYGGDSILKVLPAIKRRIQFVAVIDPVGTAGSRKIATSKVVPPNVDYFLNRWQENGLTGQNIVPFDSRISGKIRCLATKECDQDSQNLVRNQDGSENRIECGWSEITCPGYVAPNPFRRRPSERKGRKGTKAQRLEHNPMPQDQYIQHIVVEKAKLALRPFRVLK
jgi:hypothetical protein